MIYHPPRHHPRTERPIVRRYNEVMLENKIHRCAEILTQKGLALEAKDKATRRRRRTKWRPKGTHYINGRTSFLNTKRERFGTHFVR